MRLEQFIALLASDLDAWTKESGGVFLVARDPLDPLVILSAGNYNSFVVILSYLGGATLNADEHPHGIEDASVEVYLGHAIDLRAKPGAWLFIDDGAKRSMLKQLNDLRGRLLTIVFSNGPNCDDAYATAQGIAQASLPDGTPLKAYKVTASWPLTIDVDAEKYRCLN